MIAPIPHLVGRSLGPAGASEFGNGARKGMGLKERAGDGMGRLAVDFVLCRAERETSLLLALSGLDLLIVLSVRCPGLQVAE